MELAAGTRVGPYEIQRRIGAGGMGVVYRALDPRLGRAVAIKVLPESLVADPERLRRFEQEARTIGGLNHPNLVTLHDVGHHEQAPYLVTELLDGQSLRQKLQAGPVSRREAIEIATELAHGLAAAHGAGIVHRDIKPDNIFVLADGRVKILDFGIAKLKRDHDRGDLANAPTGVGPAAGATAETGTGIVIGTPGYMAPEQLSGGDIDARTDIFALGVVLYEMIARKRPFAADSAIEESYGIMKTDPGPLPASTPPALAKIILRCLAKRPDARFHSAADLGFALEALDDTERHASEPAIALPPAPVATTPAPSSAITTVASPAVRLRLFALALAIGIAGGVLVTVVALPRGKPIALNVPPAKAAPGVTQWPSRIDGGVAYTRVTYHAQAEWFARFGADGRSVVYSVREEASSADEGSKQQERWKIVRSFIDQPTVIDVGEPGRVLDLRSDHGIEQLAVRHSLADKDGGTLATVELGRGGALDRNIVVHDASFGPKGELAIARGEPAKGGSIVEYPIGHRIFDGHGSVVVHVRVSPDGEHVAIVEHTPGGTGERVSILDARTGDVAAHATRLDVDGIAWANDTDVWYSAGTAIYALGLHTADHLLLRAAMPLQLRDVDRDGRMLVAPIDQRFQLYLGGPDRPFATLPWFDAARLASISADGKTIAFALGSAASDTGEGSAFFVRAAGKPPALLAHGVQLALAGDGAVVIERGASPLQFVSPTGTSRALSTAGIGELDVDHPIAISSDGKLAVVRAGKPGERRAWAVPIAGGDPIAIGLPNDTSPTYAVSADRIAYGDDKGIVVVPFDGAKPQTFAADRAEQPLRFSADGKALFVMRRHGWPRAIERIDIATGKRTPVVTLPIAEKREDFRVAVSADAQTIGYSISVQTSDLYVIHPPQ